MGNSAAKKKNRLLSTLKRNDTGTDKKCVSSGKKVLPFPFVCKRRIQNEMECSTSTLGTYLSTSQKSLNVFDKEQESLHNRPDDSSLTQDVAMMTESQASYSADDMFQESSGQDLIPWTQEYDSSFHRRKMCRPSCRCNCDCHYFQQNFEIRTQFIAYPAQKPILYTHSFSNTDNLQEDTNHHPSPMFPYASDPDMPYALSPNQDYLSYGIYQKKHDSTNQHKSAEDPSIIEAKKEAILASLKYYGSNAISSHLYITMTRGTDRMSDY